MKEYVQLFMQILKFEEQDVVCTSGPFLDGGDVDDGFVDGSDFGDLFG